MATHSNPQTEAQKQQELDTLRKASAQSLSQHELLILRAALSAAQACMRCHVLRQNLLPEGLRTGHSQVLRLLVRVAEAGTKEEVATLMAATESVLTEKNI